MNDDQLLRYSRHILLDELDVAGQEKILSGHALIIGAGGLGSPVAYYLGTAGVGTITIVDHDTVDLTNLQRQIIHDLSRLGQPKAESAARSIAAINPEVRVRALVQRADAAALDELVAQADVVLDCSDNFATRQAVNRACVRHARPLVAGAAVRFDGQVSVYDPRRADSPCYACVFPPEQAARRPALRRHGRVRAAGGHHRHGAGRRGAQAAGRRGHLSRRPAADARCPHDGMDRDPHRPPSRLPGLFISMRWPY